jgi:uncharacterized RDD family membrane protein YckC/type II secretory pathway pseudopilin PulG
VYAGFWKRVGAYLIDSILLWGSAFALGVVIGIAGEGKGEDSLANLAGAWVPLASVGLFVVYYALMESSARQATLGKLALGIKVTGADGRRIGVGRALARYFGKFISSAILGIGFMMAGWTGRKQALHDMIAGTLVVDRNATPESLAAARGASPMPGWAIALIIVFGLLVPGGIVAAIAIPAYQDFVARARINEAVIQARVAEVAVTMYRGKRQEWPASLDEVGVDAHDTQGAFAVDRELLEGGVIALSFPGEPMLAGGRVLLSPHVDQAGAGSTWTCSARAIRKSMLPVPCRSPD